MRRLDEYKKPGARYTSPLDLMVATLQLELAKVTRKPVEKGKLVREVVATPHLETRDPILQKAAAQMKQQLRDLHSARTLAAGHKALSVTAGPSAPSQLSLSAATPPSTAAKTLSKN
jgi:hypothetical protein